MQERRTVQKNMVYAALCELGNHPTAEMVYDRVREHSTAVSRATVYRVLNRLAEQGKILRLSGEGADHYDHRVDLHHHVQCLICGRVDDVMTRELGDVTALVTDDAGYRISGGTLWFRGVCRDCQTTHESVF